MIPRLSLSAPARTLVTASLLVLALAACGRRGPLEAPLDPAAAAAQKQKEELRRKRQGAATTPSAGAVVAGQAALAPVPEDDGDEALQSNIAPIPTPTSKGGRRGYVIPKDPFILDPLL